MDLKTSNDVWEAISGLSPRATGKVVPYGNYREGLVLEEYAVAGGYLQVAFDPGINDPVDWEFTDELLDTWLVG